MILLFLITPTIRELIVAPALSRPLHRYRPLGSCPRAAGLERSDFVRWPDADLVQRLRSRQLLEVKRTRSAHRELFRV